MSARIRFPGAVCFALALVGCASALYEQNIRHAYVTPWTKLSNTDRDQIIRLVTARSLNEVIGITRYAPEEGRSGFHVYTSGVDVCYDFSVEPAASGWRIVGQDTISCGVVSAVALVFPPKSLRKW